MIKKNGFTLIELMIVVAIIGILAAVLIPALKNKGIVSVQSTAGSANAAGKNNPADPILKLQQLAEAAGQKAAGDTVEPNEINMIKYRRILNGKPGLQMYVVLLSRSGQPIDYFVTQGKCTSSEKRLTPPYKLVDPGPNSVVVKAASEDGTYGHSSPYIYCKTVNGNYKQWNGRYYVSDSPIELTIKPLVIDLSGRNQQQQ